MIYNGVILNDIDDDEYYVKTNKKLTAILDLAVKLKENDIPYELVRFFDGWKVAFPNARHAKMDAVQHGGSYGHENNLIEVMIDYSTCDIDGFLTVDESYTYFKNAYGESLKEKE